MAPLPRGAHFYTRLLTSVVAHPVSLAAHRVPLPRSSYTCSAATAAAAVTAASVHIHIRSASTPRITHPRQFSMAQPTAGPRDSLAELSKDGSFQRTPSTFRHTIAADAEEYRPEAGRYLLYVSYACPWANRCLAARTIKGLEHVIDVAVVAPIWSFTAPGKDEHRGWMFDASVSGATADPIWGAASIREVYERAHPGYVGKYTVPVLFDKKTRTIVNNESQEIVRMFNSQFNEFAKCPDVDLYPEALRHKIDAINDHVYHSINNGVYRCGFATTQAAYETAFVELFDALDQYETLLSKQRYLCGDVLTEADIRLCMTLFRFDEVYIVHFKCNKRAIREYPALSAYARDVYQTGGVGSTINMKHIKEHYYGSHNKLNPYGIIPLGNPESCNFAAPHDRAKLSGK